MSSPFPYPRPYYKGHSREQDEKLAGKLFFGITVRDKQTGRDCHQYLPENSPHERQAFDALERLLLFSCGDLGDGILGGLLCSLDPGGSFGRRLVFKPRKRKRPADSASDLQIAFYVGALVRAGEKTDWAVEQASGKFGLSRKAIYEARKRVRLENPGLKF